MSVPIAEAKFIDRIGFPTVAIHAQAMQRWQPNLATVSTMHYSESVQLFSVDQSYHRFLAVVDVARITTSRINPMVSGFRKSLRNTLLHADAIVTDS